MFTRVMKRLQREASRKKRKLVFLDDGQPAFARHSDPSTSHDAAAQVNTTRLEAIVVWTLPKYQEGLTSIAIAQLSGEPEWSMSPRMKPLREKGKIFDSGETRKRFGTHGRSSKVWK